MYALTPRATSFASPVTVHIPFDASRVGDDAAPTLYAASGGDGFTALTTTVDGNTVTAEVNGFEWVIALAPAVAPRRVYAVIPYDDTLHWQIGAYRIQGITGILSKVSASATCASPGSVAVHPSHRFAYVTCAGNDMENGVPPLAIAVYAIDQVTGALSPTPTSAIDLGTFTGVELIAPTFHPSGKFMYVAHYNSSTDDDLIVFTIDPATGALSNPTSTASGLTATPTAMAISRGGTHAYVTYMHAIDTAPDNTYWEHVEVFDVSATTGELSGPTSAVGDRQPALVNRPRAARQVRVCCKPQQQHRYVLCDWRWRRAHVPRKRHGQ